MNGSLAANRLLLGSLSAVPGIDVAVCVPYPYLAQAQAMLDGNGIALGAQDVSEYVEGPYTGEVSAAMLHDFGCVYTIVGHSERRALFAEDDLQVGRKAAAALAAGLVPIVCVGETLAERDEGRVMAVIGRQLGAVLEVLGGAALGSTVIAYEPVWAIGSGRAATIEQIAEVHVAIRGWLRGHGVSADGVRILYGGSVSANNAAELAVQPHVDGLFIGRSAWHPEGFIDILRIVAEAIR